MAFEPIIPLARATAVLAEQNGSLVRTAVLTFTSIVSGASLLRITDPPRFVFGSEFRTVYVPLPALRNFFAQARPLGESSQLPAPKKGGVQHISSLSVARAHACTNPLDGNAY